MIHWSNKFLLLTLVLILILASCEDDDPKKTPLDTNCCDGIFNNNNADFKLYLPNAYTPNGDGLNDEFSIWADSSLGVRKVTSFVATKESGDTIFSSDTMTIASTGKRNKWNVFDKTGSPYFGRVICDFIVTDTLDQTHKIRSAFCSMMCFSETKLDDDDRKQCRFEDQLDPLKGFVLPSNEPSCR